MVDERGFLHYAARRATIRRGRENRAAPVGMTSLGWWMKREVVWWTRGDSNPRPPRCERGALPAELLAHGVATFRILAEGKREDKGD